MEKRTELILYILIGLFITAILFFTFFPGMIHAIKDSGNSGSDKCAPGPGYTKESWEEHMSHHPNIYGECL